MAEIQKIVRLLRLYLLNPFWPTTPFWKILKAIEIPLFFHFSRWLQYGWWFFYCKSVSLCLISLSKCWFGFVELTSFWPFWRRSECFLVSHLLFNNRPFGVPEFLFAYLPHSFEFSKANLTKWLWFELFALSNTTISINNVDRFSHRMLR
jgi:hypothetical protein